MWRRSITTSLILLTLILLLAATLRLYRIGSVPYGLSNDEASYIYSAYTVWKTGKDMAGHFLPLSFSTSSSLSPVPIYLSAPFVGLLGLNPFVGRLPFALASIGSVLLVYLIARQLFENEKIALLAAFVMAVSPWQLHIGRTAYDGVIALFFYLLATYVFLRNRKKTSVLWSLLFFFLAFYSYHGMKVFFVFYVPLLLLVFRKDIFKTRKIASLFITGIVLILLSFAFVSQNHGVTRQSVFLWNDPQTAAKYVQFEREKNTAPFLLREVMNNKLFYYVRVIRESYLHAFSTDFLFLYGDGLGIYSMYDRGELYVFESIFVLLGLYSLVRMKEKRVAVFILGSLLLAPLPSAFTQDRNYVIRSMMMVPFLAILIALGISFLYEKVLVLPRFSRFYFPIIVFMYGVFLFSFLYQYYFRYTVYGAEQWFYSSREVLSYLNQQKGSVDQVLIKAPNDDFLMQYGIFTKADPEHMMDIWQGKTRRIGNITFLNNCIESKKQPFSSSSLPARTLYLAESSCYKESIPTKTFTEVGEPLRRTWLAFEKK